MSSLRPLYALAVALLVVAFVGFGISAFYGEPRYPDYLSGVGEGPGRQRTPEEQRKLEEYREDEKVYQRDISNYNLVVASISVGVAVLLLVASLVWISGLPVIGEGAGCLHAVLRFDPGLHDKRRDLPVRGGGRGACDPAGAGLLEVLAPSDDRLKGFVRVFRESA